MQLQQLDYVLAVVDEGSFTAAARSRGVSPPSLSQGVRALESELGAELFHRAGRRVRLSAAGEAFVGPARRAFGPPATARGGGAGGGAPGRGVPTVVRRRPGSGAGRPVPPRPPGGDGPHRRAGGPRGPG